MTQGDEEAVLGLYRSMLDAWNDRNASAFAALFTPRGNTIGFDGSPLDGRVSIEAALRDIFANHPTARYVHKIREVRLAAPGVGILRSVVGMVPPGHHDLYPAVNALQSMIALKDPADGWQIELFQNTPAAFHGRPEAAQALTAELREVLRQHP